MFKEIFSFEVRYQLSQPLFAISTVLFFLLTFGAITSDSVQIGGAIGNVHRNASFVIMQILLIMSVIGVWVTTAFVSGSIHRDFELNTHALFFSTPLSRDAYLAGRFFGSLVIAFGVFLGVVMGIIVGSAMPWLEPERIGAFAAAPYLFSLLVLVLPNLFLTGAIFFALASLTRSLLYTYAGVVGFFVLYAIVGNFAGDLENEQLASLFDPFGFAPFELATRYWTVYEKNNSILSLTGPLLHNRLIWMGVALAVLAFTRQRFRLTTVDRTAKSIKRAELAAAPASPPVSPAAPLHATLDFSASGSRRQFVAQTGQELGGILKSIPFIVIMLLGMFNVVGGSASLEELFGTPVYPVTHIMLNVIQGAFLLFAFIIITFYSGELVWRERQLKLSDVFDSLPVPSWVYWGSKSAALIVTVAILLGAAALASIGVQLFKGYHHLEPLLYAKGLFLNVGTPLVLMAVLALFFQVIVNHKFAGFLLMVLFFVSGIVLPSLDLEHHLYRYGSAPPAPYSDMNGYGHFVASRFWFYLYWSLFAVVLLVVAHLFWVRGTEKAFRVRSRLAWSRFSAAPRAVMALALVGFVAVGAFIFYNTNVLNRYRTADDVEAVQARFEKNYKKYEGFPQPRITAVKVDVDLFPSERDASIRGTYRLENRTAAAIRDLHVVLNPDVQLRRIGIPGSRIKQEDKEGGYRIFELAQPLPPGGVLPMSFELAVVNDGFVNSRSNTNFVRNGTFFNSEEYLPNLGYTRFLEIQDRNKRKKQGLTPIQRMRKIDDPKGVLNNYISSDSDWLDLETTISTSPDQIAIAPGYLQREWTTNGRRFFHYKMDSPILGFFGWLSADYKVKRDRWKDVAIEIYYHEPHSQNVGRMVESVKKSLDYFTANFGPYQHRQVRIVEFPRYARFAQSLPNTIPFSESIGFIADLTDKEAIDYVFYVTAHEVAHQWWAHQVIGGNVQGTTLMSETMSQYSALMVMEKEYGRDRMRKFLAYELDRYLQGRGGELVEEMPLKLVEDQPYVHYRKGSLAMYALRDYIGEAPLNRALKAYVEKVHFQQPPYTTSVEFLSFIRPVVPPHLKNIVSDLFEQITLYDNRATDVKWRKRSDGKYAVTMSFEARKFRSDGSGKETEVPIDDWIDLGVFAAGPKGKDDDQVLILAKHRIRTQANKVELIVDREPVRAGIDPWNKLIDRNPKDNRKVAEKVE